MRSIVVFAGGALGAMARWGVDVLVADYSWPAATFAVNISGAFLLGALGVILIERMAGSGHLRAFLLIGLIGSYTTFSAMSVEGVLLVDEGTPLLAVAYWLATLLVGLAAGVAGVWLGRARA